MGNCTGTTDKKPKQSKTEQKINPSVTQKYSSNVKTNNVNSINNPSLNKKQKVNQSVSQALVGKKQQTAYGHTRYDSNRFPSGDLDKLGQKLKPSINQMSGKFNDVSRNIKESNASYENLLNNSFNEGKKSVNDYQLGLKDSFGNVQNKMIKQSKDLFNPERVQQQNSTIKLIPNMKDTMDNFYLPTAAPYPERQFKSKFDWALDTSDQNFKLEPESIVIPSIDLKIS